MSKHHLDGPLPPAKRIHLVQTVQNEHRIPVSLENFSDELIVSIFTYLDFADLCHIQPTCHSWSRLSLDNELWKALYIRTFGGRTRLRGARGFIGRTDGREIKPLPGRSEHSTVSEDLTRNWKWMFRIGSNWRTGRCSVGTLSQERVNCHTVMPESHMHLLLVNSLTITASSQPSLSPTIIIHSEAQAHTIRLHSSHVDREFSITCLALDQAAPRSHTIHLVAFLSTSEFCVYELDLRHLDNPAYKMIFVPRRNARSSLVIQAAYHHPLLVTLSDNFSLRLYDLSDSNIVHTQTLSSFTSFPPSSLVLSRPSSSVYKLVMAYSIPVYPAHWSVGATELQIGGKEDNTISQLPTSREVLSSIFRSSHTPMTVISTRTIRTVDVPLGWIDEVKFKAMRDQWGRKVKRVADTRTDGRWVILAPGEGDTSLNRSNTALYDPTVLQLYKLYLPNSSTSTSAPKLVFVRSLHGQTGQITALALSDGRCVSLSENGGIWVWDLEGGCQGAEVASSLPSPISTSGKGSIVFDDRAIVSAGSGSDIVQVRRFDV